MSVVGMAFLGQLVLLRGVARCVMRVWVSYIGGWVLASGGGQGVQPGDQTEEAKKLKHR